MKVIGIAGTAKNTGKTTTTAALLKEGYRRKRRMAITSIGFDGEELDNVTGLPKPRLWLEEGTVVATARKCLPLSSADIRILEDTSIATALGSIVIGQVESAGRVVIAGPNKSHELAKIKKSLQKYKPQLVFVDGALNRMAPMVETDGLILATGAARHVEPAQLATETTAISAIFRLTATTFHRPNDQLGFAYWHDNQWHEKNIAQNVLITAEDGQDLAEMLAPSLRENSRGYVNLPGFVTLRALEKFLEKAATQMKGWSLLFRDPVSLLLSDDPKNVGALLRMLGERRLKAQVRKKIPLIAITVNPFYPEYDRGAQLYRSRYLPTGVLESPLYKLPLPVLDVKRKGPLYLWRKTIGF
ncbi:hypothetical protein [Heliorestis convoluta]|uniref:Uncharacterized protein n=1 Tax=Heliorestis convoluta TaxID=356322 RepID=A0A5Q2N117_9FIRM|nr:hypothetical protein [Heliorestis convoluta]QGG47266.1 hypothetical protein FTV88_1119 [Heliorestis convoluta]